MLHGERDTGIRQWLRERITFEQAEARYVELEQELFALTGTTGGGWIDTFREQIAAEFRTGDELWLYASGAESWANLYGESGLAHVRDGQVIGRILECMN